MFFFLPTVVQYDMSFTQEVGTRGTLGLKPVSDNPISPLLLSLFKSSIGSGWSAKLFWDIINYYIFTARTNPPDLI